MITTITPRENYVRGPVWASEEARMLWQQKLAAAVLAWTTVERESVGVLRESALIVATDSLVELSSWAARTKRQITFLAESGSGKELRAVVHVPSAELSEAWMGAWENGNNDQIGRLLGYPDCCRGFFARTWEGGARDTTMQQFDAAGTADGPVGCNLLLRWLGVRLIPHLACSYRCEPSAALAERFVQLGEQLGLPMTTVEELLALPFTVSSMHGTSEIITPVLKLEVDSDVLKKKRSFSRAATVVPKRLALPQTSWEDNGFSSRELMQNSHMIVSSVVPRTPGGTVLDLGCGDGTLLERLRTRDGLALASGVDADAGRIGRGMQRYPELFLACNRIEALEAPTAQTVLFMPGRLLEMNEEDAARVRRWVLSDRFQYVVLYSYDGSLEDLCERTNVLKPKHIVRSHGGVAEAGALGK